MGEVADGNFRMHIYNGVQSFLIFFFHESGLYDTYFRKSHIDPVIIKWTLRTAGRHFHRRKLLPVPNGHRRPNRTWPLSWKVWNLLPRPNYLLGRSPALTSICGPTD